MKLLSIIIPTKNRPQYLVETVLSILDIESNEFELLVQDNSSTDEMKDWATSLNDERLIYKYSQKKLDMVSNYETALHNSSGLYVTFLGDDDTLGGQVIDAVKYAYNEGYDAIVPKALANYVWPDLNLKINNASGGHINIRPFEKIFYEPNGKNEIMKCMLDAGQNFHALPKSYYGIVRRKCFDKVKETSGSYFPGISPDLSSAIALACVLDKYIYVDFPICIPGSSAKSNAGLSGMKKHIGSLRDQAHLPENVEKNWSQFVPLFYSVETIWAESAIGAASMMKNISFIECFNYSKLYALCCSYHPEYVSATMKAFLRYLKNKYFYEKLKVIFLFNFYILQIFLSRIGSLICRKLGLRVFKVNIGVVNNDVTDIRMARRYFDSYVGNFRLKDTNFV